MNSLVLCKAVNQQNKVCIRLHDKSFRNVNIFSPIYLLLSAPPFFIYILSESLTTFPSFKHSIKLIHSNLNIKEG